MLKKLLLGLLLLGSSCSGSSDGSAREAGDSEGNAEFSDGAASSGDAAEDQTVAGSETTSTMSEVADEPGLPMANGVEIEQLTAKSGGGARPMLSWTPLSAADSYTVVVYDAAGEPWWSWSGSGTEIVIGGVETDVEIGGPRANLGVRWVVMAFDVDQNLVGSSPRRSIEP